MRSSVTPDLAGELGALPAKAGRSVVRGHEYVRGWGVFALPFDSGHVLALRVFPENDFAPFVSVWHRTPEGEWSIYVDGPRLDTACPRYFGDAAVRSRATEIDVRWTGPASLRVEMDDPRLVLELDATSTRRTRAMNAVGAALPDRLWRSPPFLALMARLAGPALDLGRIDLTGTAPNGQRSFLAPRRLYFVRSASATLDGVDLGNPERVAIPPRIGAMRLASRPVLAVGEAFFEMGDPVEYDRTVTGLRDIGT